MSTHRTRTRSAANEANLTPQVLTAWLSAFRDCFTAPAWNHVLVLVAGAVLAPGKRTVSQALRVMGAGGETGLRTLPRGAEPGALGRTRRRAQTSCTSARRLPAGGRGGDRHRRHHRATLGRQDQGARHLPRSVALLAGPFRQGEWSALPVVQGHGTD